MRTGLVALVLVGGLWGAQSAYGDAVCPSAITGYGSGNVYYVSPDGSDGNSGTSPCAPWRSMTKVDSAVLRPGDTVAFLGGQTFTAPLAPWSGTSGSAGSPIVYTSYGTGSARLTSGVYLNSDSYLTFTRLDITSSTSPGIGTGGSGGGATNIVVSNSTISSSYDDAVGGYGIALRNSLDSGWIIQGDTIENTADSGVFARGSNVTVEQDLFDNNGIGSHCGTGTGQNPCHAIYAKGPNFTIINNTIADPQTAGISLRRSGDIVQDNTVSGGLKGIEFSSETSMPGTTYIVGNTVWGQSDCGIQLYSGTQSLYESFVVASNTIYNSGNYALYIVSGPNSATSQSVTLANNVFDTGSGSGLRAYLNLASPFGYTKSTYIEHYDVFYGASSASPFYVNGSARTWAGYSSWFGVGGEGMSDITQSDPLLDTATFELGNGSPAVGAGTSDVPGIRYVRSSSCPISGSTTQLQWQYCSSAPNMGSH